MGSDTITLQSIPRAWRGTADLSEFRPALVVVWSATEPHRIGEIAQPPDNGRSVTLGRHPPDSAHLSLQRLVAGARQETGQLMDRAISREQIALRQTAGGMELVRRGRLPLLVNGAPCEQCEVMPGQLVELEDRIIFLVESRPDSISEQQNWSNHTFGDPDVHGIVGESPECWSLRQRLRTMAGRSGHLLIHGESGAGKELAARAIHAMSSRAPESFVARNAATMPEGLLDAELFGNVAGFPHASLSARQGLIGAADRGSLLLDEVGELPTALQAHLLRVLDAGEYQRLGESRTRRSNFRLIGATNRPPSTLKHDLLARLEFRVELPGLGARRSDIPLMIRSFMRHIAQEDPAISRRFMVDGHPRLTPAFARFLLSHSYTTHARELRRMLWESADRSPGEYLDLIGGSENESSDPLSREGIQAALDRHNGVQERVWRELGLSSRHALRRLMIKHGLLSKPQK